MPENDVDIFEAWLIPYCYFGISISYINCHNFFHNLTVFFINTLHLNPIFKMGFFGAAHGWGRGAVQKAPPHPYNLSHISYNDENWHSITLPKKDPKNIWITWHNLWFLLTHHFFTRNHQIMLSRNTDIDCILIQDF